MSPAPSKLRTDLAGLRLRCPVLLAAGTAGVLDEMAGACPLDRIGGLVTKSITRRPRDGNAVWRILESRVGMLNAIGLANPGVERFVAEFAPRAVDVPALVIASVAGHTIDEYVEVAAAIDAFADPGAHPKGRPNPEPAPAIPAIELNVSCPNVQTGLDFGQTAADLSELLGAVRPAVRHARLFVKLSPAVSDIVSVAAAAIDAGVDALTICNTIPAMEIDVATRRPRLSNVTGGLSGPALHPVAVRLVHTVYREVARGASVPLIGVGGIMTWRDAAQFILAGATAVQLGTVLFTDPRAPLNVAKGLAEWTLDQGAKNIAELVGRVETG